MARGCEIWNRFVSADEEARLPAAARREWQEHLWSCASCRAEWEARAAILEVVSDRERPQLSHGFETRLLRRLEEAAVPRLDARARRWLRLYWTLAALVSAWILVRHPFPAEWLTASLFVAALALIVAELVPARVVRKMARALALARAR